LFAFAQLGNVENIVQSIGNLVNLATPIVVGLALLAFFWGLVKFIFSADDEEARKGAKSLMIWSVVALFVMVSIVGIINFIGNAVGVNQGGSLPVPTVEN
jgi:heme/copper-type cytochrome/quinol oxidase subunit 2